MNIATRNSLLIRTMAFLLAGFFGAAPGAGQTIGFERDRGREMLNVIKNDIKRNYYDPSFHGVDLDARFKAAEEKIKQATTVGQVQAVIAQALIDFNDSHLFFIPPEKANRTEYGWRMQMIGDKPIIVAVQPGTDAEAKGLRPGDEIYSLDGFVPTRENIWKMKYFYYALRPKPAVKLELITPAGEKREVEVRSKISEGRRIKDVSEDLGEIIRESENEAHLSRHRFYAELPDVFVWKMPQFDLSESEVDSVIDKAKKHKALIIDLRGNGGGFELTQLRLVANFFDHDIKVGDIKRRSETKPLIAKTRGANNIFTGPVVVIVDSESGSSAEIFARVIQIEKRGTVVGDQTAGAVMRARQYQHESGQDVVAFYGVSITDADLIMTDGKSLEKTGVMPDERLLISPAALAKGRDPVLSRAAALVGVKLDPEKAGLLFPIEWRK